MNAEHLARVIHGLYEETAPEFGHGARRLPVPVTGGRRELKREPVPWDRVPHANQEFLTELAGRLLDALLPEPGPRSDRSPTQILIAAIYADTTGLREGTCADIADAQLEALAEAGYLIVARDDLRVAWSLAAKARSELPADQPASPVRQQTEAAMDRLYRLMVAGIPASRRVPTTDTDTDATTDTDTAAACEEA